MVQLEEMEYEGRWMKWEEGCQEARFEGDSDRGDFGDKFGDLVTSLNFDGDLESDRLMVLATVVRYRTTSYLPLQE